MATPVSKPESRVEPVIAAESRTVISGLATAVSVLTTDRRGGKAGLTCSAVCSVSDSPSTYFKDALAARDCEVVEAREVATHGVLIGRVLATADNGSAEPLIHHRQRYATTRVLP